MYSEGRRKNIAPKDESEQPLEERCPNCWRILGELETDEGKVVQWCSNCHFIKKVLDKG